MSLRSGFFILGLGSTGHTKICNHYWKIVFLEMNIKKVIFDRVQNEHETLFQSHEMYVQILSRVMAVQRSLICYIESYIQLSIAWYQTGNLNARYDTLDLKPTIESIFTTSAFRYNIPLQLVNVFWQNQYFYERRKIYSLSCVIFKKKSKTSGSSPLSTYDFKLV